MDTFYSSFPRSSGIRSLLFFSKRSYLLIEFVNGKKRLYKDVPLEIGDFVKLSHSEQRALLQVI